MVEIEYTHSSNILNKLQKKEFSSADYFKLNYLANKIMLRGKKEELMSLDEIKEKITFYPHQVGVALKFLNDMDGRLLIADEVGLGKTIEAGIILKELMVREEVKRVLILCPASLTTQWQAEMQDKFLLDFEINKSVHKWNMYNLIISSIDTAKMEKHIREIGMLKWDLIIIDEAHKLKNRSTKAHKAFRDINSNYKLFLTATPIQNSLLDLYNIIDLLDKQYLGASTHEFKSTYFDDDKGLKLRNKALLNQKLKGIMSRSTRKETGLEFTKRKVFTTLIEEGEKESEFSELAIEFIKKQYTSFNDDKTNLKGVGTLQLMSLTRMLTSCRYAFSKSFSKYLKNNISDPIDLEVGNEILKINETLPENKKFTKTIELIKKIDDKVIIFTQFLATQGELAEEIRKLGYKVELVKGNMNSEEKKQAIRNFKVGKADILIGTESASEGLNLQFCHNLINYDLPWNPMKVEQRIGRVHRIGQEYDVKIYNLAVKGTIEEYILKRLYDKIDLFHSAIGDIAEIITNVMDEDSFEKSLFDILMTNKNKVDVKKKMDELFQKVSRSAKFQDDIKKLDDHTLNLFDLSPLKNDK